MNFNPEQLPELHEGLAHFSVTEWVEKKSTNDIPYVKVKLKLENGAALTDLLWSNNVVKIKNFLRSVGLENLFTQGLIQEQHVLHKNGMCVLAKMGSNNPEYADRIGVAKYLPHNAQPSPPSASLKTTDLKDDEIPF